MKKLFFSFLALMMVSSLAINAQNTIHCWDFNNGNATSGNFRWTSPIPVDARVEGSGTITHNFLNNLQSFAGSALNACAGSAIGFAFCPQGGTNTVNNGNFMTMEFSTVGFEDVFLTVVNNRTSNGFDTVVVSYSTNGGTTFTFLTNIFPSTSFNIDTVDFSAIAAANDNADFQVRFTFNGATNATGNARIDNLKLEGTALGVIVPSRANVLHYWHFNNLASGAQTSVSADTTIFATAPVITYPGTGAGFIDRNTSDGSLNNARFGQPADNSLRARNPSDTRTLDIELPTTGYEDIVFSYEVYRSNNGQLGQVVEYTTDGTNYVFADSLTITETYQTFFWDFSNVAGVSDNPDFKVRINFFGQHTGTSGNNRFDNFVLEGNPVPFVPVYPIASLRSVNANGVADSLNVNCAIEGVVSGGNLINNGSQFWFIDSTNSAGLLVRQPGFTLYTPTEGDVLRIYGTVTQFRGLIQFTIDSLQTLGTNFTLPAPAVVTSLDESTEGRLVRINGLSLVSPSQWTGTGTGFNIDVTNGTDVFLARVASFVSLFNDPVPTTAFDLIGHGGQFSSAATAPFNDGYQILPRYSADLIPDTTTPPTPVVINRYPIASLRGVNADGVADSLGVMCSIVGVVSGGNLINNGAQFWFIDSVNTAGVLVRQPGFTNYSPTEGDVLEIFGNVSQFRGLIQFSIDSLDVLGTGFTLPAPAVVTELNEATEGRLITIENLTLVDTAQWVAGGSGFNADATNGVDTFLIRVVQPTTLFNEPVPTSVFNIIGHGSQFNPTTTAPLLSGYQIQPRYKEDLILNISVDVALKSEIKLYPNPANQFVRIQLANSADADMIMYDNAGRLISSGKIRNGETMIETAQFAAGMYIIRLIQNGEQATIRLVIQH